MGLRRNETMSNKGMNNKISIGGLNDTHTSFSHNPAAAKGAKTKRKNKQTNRQTFVTVQQLCV